MKNSSLTLVIVGALMAILSTIGQASAFSSNDAAYLTESLEFDELDYVICLEEEVGKTPRNMPMRDALRTSDRICARSGFTVSRSSFPRDIHDFVLRCGFRPDEAKPGMRCGRNARVSAPPPAPRCTPPEIFVAGSCRNPNPTPAPARCRPPEIFVAGKCRNPNPTAVAPPTCPPGQFFAAGKCR